MTQRCGPFSLRTVMSLPSKSIAPSIGPFQVPSATTTSSPSRAASIAAWMVA